MSWAGPWQPAGSPADSAKSQSTLTLLSMERPAARAVRYFGRAIRLRCPHCGGRPILRSWLRLRPYCPVCGIALERGESGYQVGSYMFNMIASELIFAILFIGTLLLTWPSPPWTLLEYGGIALMVLAPFLFFPFSKTLFLAFDLLFRPATPEELS
jgi:uncharacterized protein (DUF983 family)